MKKYRRNKLEQDTPWFKTVETVFDKIENTAIVSKKDKYIP